MDVTIIDISNPELILNDKLKIAIINKISDNKQIYSIKKNSETSKIIFSNHINYTGDSASFIRRTDSTPRQKF